MLVIYLFGIFVTTLIIWKVSDEFEEASNYLGRNMTEGVKGATINAVGSSLPELMTTLLALFVYKDKEGFIFGLGTTAGSAIFNIAIIPALSILTVIYLGISKYVNISKKVVIRDGFFLLFAEFCLIFLLKDDFLSIVDGVILVTVYLIYLATLFISFKRSSVAGGIHHFHADESLPNDSNIHRFYFPDLLKLKMKSFFFGDSRLNNKKAWFLLTLCLILMAMTCHALVSFCYSIGEILNIHIYFVAVILAAAATSIPDTILSMKDAKNGNIDDSVSNAVGSNIFDICICLGFPIIIFCLTNDCGMHIISGGNAKELRILLFIFTFLVVTIILIGNKIGRLKSWLMLGLYGIFCFYIIGKALNMPLAIWFSNILQNIVKWM